MSSAYARLVEESHRIQLVADAQSVLSWDQEVLLPKNGIDYRARQMAWFSGWVHEETTAPKRGELLAEAEAEPVADDPAVRANLREWRHDYERANRLPKEWVESFAEVRVRAQAVWAEARENSDFSAFAPMLARLVDLCREEADYYGYDECNYDALVEKFERGCTTRRLTETLGSLRDRLVPLVDAAVAREAPDFTLEGMHFPRDRQEAFNREVAESIGFDFEAGRVDTAVHPFCSSMGPRDVRLTTRYDESDFLSSLFGVLHEAGHGLYEQGLPADRRGEPAGASASLGIHESQSRLWENHVGRSRPFWEKWLPRAIGFFPVLEGASVDDMVRLVNRARRSYVRVEADEVTYDLHILLRFELEKELFAGEIAVEDVPGEWNRRFEEYFGIPVKKDSDGCLQDIHWSMGIFGYFPTYSLGNLNAAHLMRAALGDEKVASGFDRADYAPLLDWMRDRIHRHGFTWMPDELIRRATGSDADSGALVSHLESRYLEDRPESATKTS